MKSKILGLLAVGLLGLPAVSNAVPMYYDVTFSGGSPGNGSFEIDSVSLELTNFFVDFGSGSTLLPGSLFSGNNGACLLDYISGQWQTSTYCGGGAGVGFFSGIPSDLQGVLYFDGTFYFAIASQEYSGDFSIAPRGAPVPEPGSLALLGLGLFGLGLSRRRA